MEPIEKSVMPSGAFEDLYNMVSDLQARISDEHRDNENIHFPEYSYPTPEGNINLQLVNAIEDQAIFGLVISTSHQGVQRMLDTLPADEKLMGRIDRSMTLKIYPIKSV